VIRLPDPSLVILVGAAGSGKSTWATRHIPAGSIVSSDSLRGLVGIDESDQRASGDAFAVLDEIVERRLARRLLTCIDSTGLDRASRDRWIEMGRAAGVAVHVVTFPVDEKTARARVKRRSRSIPSRIVTRQLLDFDTAVTELGVGDLDGLWDTEGGGRDVRIVPAHLLPPTEPAPESQPGLGVDLLIGGFDREAVDLGPWLRDVAEAAEAAGFCGLWITDHLVQIPQAGRPWDHILDPYLALAHVAATTRRLRLGVLVSPPTFRHPVVVGKAVATLDVLSGGRARCGLGVGWWADEHQRLGLAFPPTAERYRLLADGLELMRALWAGGTPKVVNDTYQVPEAISYPRPLQDQIPVVIGGDGETATLPLAARVADAVNLSGPVTDIERRIDVVHRACVDAGRDPAGLTITHRTHLDRQADLLADDVLIDHLTALAGAGVASEVISLGTPDPTQVAAMGTVVEAVAGPHGPTQW